MFTPIKRMLVGVGALAALALGGAAIADATTSSTTPTTTTSATSGHAIPAMRGPAPGTAAHEHAEKAVTGAKAVKARAAAVKSVGNGTVGAVTTDITGQGFETTVTKTNGTKVEVHLDSSYRVMQGPGGSGGSGGPGGHTAGGRGGPPPAAYGG